MRLTDSWISDSHLQTVLHSLSDAGHQALLVGGCVRNGLLREPIDDIDIATDALPQRVIEIMEAAGLRTVPTGVDHGTVTVIACGKPHEVTTFRRDIETDGRRAKVAFSEAIHEDAARRDFTMNALYADADGRIIDPLEGLADLRARRVRFVGAPEARIQEDYLRILRFFRFHARYGDQTEGLDKEGLAACATLSAGIETLSKERVGHEMRKLLAAHDPAPAVAAMAQAGVLARILPGATIQPLGPLIHLEGTLTPDPIRRLAAIGGVDPAAQLKLSRAEEKHLSQVIANAGSLSGPAELAYRFGAKLALDIMLVRAAAIGQQLPLNYAVKLKKGAEARFPVRAADLPSFSGSALGARLKELEERWIASDFELSREQLLS
jgi:poly(A) polymerase